MSFIRRIWDDPVWSKVISAGIIALPGSAVWVWWDNLYQWADVVIVFLVDSTSLPNWLLSILGFLALTAVAVAILVVIAAITPSENDSGPKWNDYYRDHFLDMVWRWRYESDGDICRLTPFCPHCDYELIAQDASAFAMISNLVFTCEHCSRFSTTINQSAEEIKGRVERSIRLKLRSGEWKVVLGKAAPHNA